MSPADDIAFLIFPTRQDDVSPLAMELWAVVPSIHSRATVHDADDRIVVRLWGAGHLTRFDAW